MKGRVSFQEKMFCFRSTFRWRRDFPQDARPPRNPLLFWGETIRAQAHKFNFPNEVNKQEEAAFGLWTEQKVFSLWVYM